MNALRGIVLGATLALTAGAGAIVFEQRDFDNAEQLARYKTLIYELRCLVCQNQNLADSNADLAADLRREVHRLILEGKSNQDIIDFMVARYGEFVLYRPPFKATTAILWGGPFLLLALGIWLLLRQLRRRASAGVDAESLSAEERARLERMFETRDSENDRGPGG